jgi:hypothetical protein
MPFPLDFVEVNLKYPPFADQLLGPARQDILPKLAGDGLLPGEQDVLDHLLGDRAAAARKPPFLRIMDKRIPGGLIIDPCMFKKSIILCGHDRLNNDIREAGKRYPYPELAVIVLGQNAAVPIEHFGGSCRTVVFEDRDIRQVG